MFRMLLIFFGASMAFWSLLFWLVFGLYGSAVALVPGSPFAAALTPWASLVYLGHVSMGATVAAGERLPSMGF